MTDNLYDIGTSIDLRKNKTQARSTFQTIEYAPGTRINIWAIRRQRLVDKLSVINITSNLVAY